MEQLKIALEEQKKVKERLTEILRVEVDNTDPNKIDYDNSGGVADMIKDLAEAEKNCWEAQYYKMLCEAMMYEEDPENSNRLMGYNHNRFKNGEFAPSGHGNATRGYQPEMRIPPEMRHMFEHERFGSGGSSSGGSGRSGYSGEWDSQLGEPYNRYKEALRHYHETGQKEDMDEMDTHAGEHIKSAVRSFREIYKSASPSIQKRLKEDLTKLVGEM